MPISGSTEFYARFQSSDALLGGGESLLQLCRTGVRCCRSHVDAKALQALPRVFKCDVAMKATVSAGSL
jgi:hypothetical protein